MDLRTIYSARHSLHTTLEMINFWCRSADFQPF